MPKFLSALRDDDATGSPIPQTNNPSPGPASDARIEMTVQVYHPSASNMNDPNCFSNRILVAGSPCYDSFRLLSICFAQEIELGLRAVRRDLLVSENVRRKFLCRIVFII